MNLSFSISNIHWIPVVVMTVFSFLLGAFWHTPLLFGKTWKKENNYDNIQKRTSAPLLFGGTAVMHFLAISGLSALISGQGGINGLLSGLFISIVWIVPAMVGTYLFASRSIKLLVIDTGMYVVLFSISGLILGIWK